MLLVWISSAVAGLILRKRGGIGIVAVLLIGVVTTGIAVNSNRAFAEFQHPIGPEQTVNIYGPSTYPFTILMYHDFEARSFYYQITIGGLDGQPVFTSEVMDDQSEFMHLQGFSIRLLLGAIGLIPLVVALYIWTVLYVHSHSMNKEHEIIAEDTI